MALVYIPSNLLYEIIKWCQSQDEYIGNAEMINKLFQLRPYETSQTLSITFYDEIDEIIGNAIENNLDHLLDIIITLIYDSDNDEGQLEVRFETICYCGDCDLIRYVYEFWSMRHDVTKVSLVWTGLDTLFADTNTEFTKSDSKKVDLFIEFIKKDSLKIYKQTNIVFGLVNDRYDPIYDTEINTYIDRAFLSENYRMIKNIKKLSDNEIVRIDWNSFFLYTCKNIYDVTDDCEKILKHAFFAYQEQYNPIRSESVEVLNRGFTILCSMLEDCDNRVRLFNTILGLYSLYCDPKSIECDKCGIAITEHLTYSQIS